MRAIGVVSDVYVGRVFWWDQSERVLFWRIPVGIFVRGQTDDNDDDDDDGDDGVVDDDDKWWWWWQH